jgi:hypothetical protein
MRFVFTGEHVGSGVVIGWLLKCEFRKLQVLGCPLLWGGYAEFSA